MGEDQEPNEPSKVVIMNSNLESSLKDVQSHTVVLQDMGNPFLEESNNLLVIDTKDIMESVAGTVRKVETIGEEQYSKFVDERLSKWVTPVSDPLSKNKPLFSRPAVKAPSKAAAAVNEE